jgi:hypothetical protein
MKPIFTLHLNSITYSIRILSVQIWPTHDLRGRKPFCCLRIEGSITGFKQFIIMWVSILDGTLSKVIPLQLSQTDRSPFFGNGIIQPVFQSSGWVSDSHTFINAG